VFEEVVAELHDRGTSVLLTSHDLGGVERIADRVGILRQGKLVVDDPLESLRARMRLLRYRKGPGATGAELGGLEVLASETGPLGTSMLVTNFDDQRFARFVARPGVIDPKPSALSLEEIFVAITSGTGGAS
jgi:ABC-2 type transport system ATP-binding protein